MFYSVLSAFFVLFFLRQNPKGFIINKEQHQPIYLGFVSGVLYPLSTYRCQGCFFTARVGTHQGLNLCRCRWSDGDFITMDTTHKWNVDDLVDWTFEASHFKIMRPTLQRRNSSKSTRLQARMRCTKTARNTQISGFDERRRSKMIKVAGCSWAVLPMWSIHDECSSNTFLNMCCYVSFWWIYLAARACGLESRL